MGDKSSAFCAKNHRVVNLPYPCVNQLVKRPSLIMRVIWMFKNASLRQKKEEHMITPQIRENTGEGNTMAEQFLAEWGTAILFVNGRPAQCTVKALPCHTEQFCVKGRVCLSCSIPKSVHSEETSIKCRVLFHDASDVEPCTETGEDLALVSYYFHNYKISVGTLGDQKDTRYVYTSDGLEIITKCTISR